MVNTYYYYLPIMVVLTAIVSATVYKFVSK